MHPIMKYLTKWNSSTDNLAKLQAAYGVLALATLLIAGLVSLIHYNLGQSILFLAIVFGLTFIGNGVVWALVRTFALPHIEKAKPTSTRKK